jgi:uncharacterized protein (DUF433 family)
MTAKPTRKVVVFDPAGTPVFFETDIPLQRFIDSMNAGETLEQFPREFPVVKKWQIKETFWLMNHVGLIPVYRSGVEVNRGKLAEAITRKHRGRVF